MSEPSANQAGRGCRIEAQDLVRRFGDHLALDAVSLGVEPG